MRSLSIKLAKVMARLEDVVVRHLLWPLGSHETLRSLCVAISSNLKYHPASRLQQRKAFCLFPCEAEIAIGYKDG